MPVLLTNAWQGDAVHIVARRGYATLHSIPYQKRAPCKMSQTQKLIKLTSP
jgi:hypothetical protein